MFYRYECECGEITEIQCTIAEMTRTIVCPKCSAVANKVIEAPTLVGVSSTRSAINKEITKKNIEAGKKCRGSHKSMKG